MNTSAETTDQIFLAVDAKGESISFPVKDKDDWVQKTLTLEIFLVACSKVTLKRTYLVVAEAQKDFFKDFLKVILQFQQLGILS